MQLSCVVAAGFGLNKTFRVPAQVWKQLPELQPRPDPEHHDDDPAPDPAPLSDEHGAAPKPPSEDVELSDFEKRRLANIANNQAQLAMLGLGASAAGASEAAPQGRAQTQGPPALPRKQGRASPLYSSQTRLRGPLRVP